MPTNITSPSMILLRYKDAIKMTFTFTLSIMGTHSARLHGNHPLIIKFRTSQEEEVHHSPQCGAVSCDNVKQETIIFKLPLRTKRSLKKF